MKFVNQYMKYVYILLVIVLIVVIIRLLLRLLQTMKVLQGVAESSENVNNGLDQISEKSERIASTTEGWSFFSAVLLLFSLARQVDKSRKKGKSLSRSVSATVIRNASKLSKLKI